MHDTTAPKENSSKLPKQKDIIRKQNKQKKGTNGGGLLIH